MAEFTTDCQPVGCTCIGHRFPGVSHMVPCCDEPHVPEPAVSGGLGDLSNFILARLAEDAMDYERMGESVRLAEAVETYLGGKAILWEVVLTRSKMLDENDAKRRILYANCAMTDERSISTMKWLAMPYAAHKGYRQEWTP